MTYSESEKAWLKRRAQKIATETGYPLSFACSAAMAELLKVRQKPKGRLIPFPRPAAAPRSRRA